MHQAYPVAYRAAMHLQLPQGLKETPERISDGVFFPASRFYRGTYGDAIVSSRS